MQITSQCNSWQCAVPCTTLIREMHVLRVYVWGYQYEVFFKKTEDIFILNPDHKTEVNI
jgi:hypothetical protein